MDQDPTRSPTVDPAPVEYQPMESGVDLYRRLLTYTRRYIWVFAVAVIAMIVTALANMGFVTLLKPIVDEGLVASESSQASMIPIYIAVIVVVRAIAEFINVYGMNWVGRRVVFDIRSQLFDHTLRLPATYYDQHGSSRLVSKLIHDVEKVADASGLAVRILVQDSCTIIALLGWMAWINWKLTLAICLVIPAVSLIVRVTTKRYRRSSTHIQQSMGDIAGVASQTFLGNRLVKSYNAYDYHREHFSKANKKNYRSTMKRIAVTAASVPMMVMLVGLGMAYILSIIIGNRESHGMTPGEFMSFFGALVAILGPLKRLGKVNETVQTGLVAANSAFSIIDMPREQDNGTQLLTDKPILVEFDNVSFSYAEDSSERVLNSVSFSVKEGETLALVGRSGAGKSTIVSLLLRFYEPNSGAVCINGHNAGDYQLASYRSAFSLVTQDVHLVDDTIRNNIVFGRRYGHSDDRVDENALQQAARDAHVSEFADKLSDGLNTLIGPGGTSLSGGQKQRIAIARALYKNAPLLILDEATSSLDNISEKLIQDALRELTMSRTTIVIAHRLSTIQEADRIIVLDQGGIIETGTHKDLMHKGGAYQALAQYGFAAN